jgi:hypothetical protein
MAGWRDRFAVGGDLGWGCVLRELSLSGSLGRLPVRKLLAILHHLLAGMNLPGDEPDDGEKDAYNAFFIHETTGRTACIAVCGKPRVAALGPHRIHPTDGSGRSALPPATIRGRHRATRMLAESRSSTPAHIGSPIPAHPAQAAPGGSRADNLE